MQGLVKSVGRGRLVTLKLPGTGLPWAFSVSLLLTGAIAGCDGGDGQARKGDDGSPIAARAAPPERAPADAAPPPVCKGHRGCIEFIDTIERFEQVSSGLMLAIEAGDFGTEQVRPALEAKKLAKRLRALACEEDFPIDEACGLMVDVHKKMRNVHAQTQESLKATQATLRQDCEKAVGAYSRESERLERPSPSFPTVERSCGDYLYTITLDGAPDALMHSEGVQVVGQAAELMRDALVQCAEHRVSEARVTRCVRDAKNDICSDVYTPYVEEHGRKARSWLLRDATLVPREWPEPVAVRNLLKECS